MSIFKLTIDIKKILKDLLIVSKEIMSFSPRFQITNNKVLKNNYYEKSNFEIKFAKIKKRDRDLIYRYLDITSTDIGEKSFLNWGGGFGILDLLIQKKNNKIKTTIIEKKNLVEKIKSNSKLFNKYKNRNISFSTDQNLFKINKFDMILFFGSLCYFPDIYSFFQLSKAKYIAISRLPMIINSQEDFIAHDNYGDHYEYFLSVEKFKNFILKNFKILYFNEHWGGLKKNKQKIQQYKIKSFDILLERLN